MPLLDSLLSSPLVESLAKLLRTPITISTESDRLGELYLDPLYLLPIAGVLAFCFLVYAFGFKSTSSIPPTLHLLIDDDDRRPSRKEKKKQDKKPSKPQANGHANSAKPLPKPVVKPLQKTKSVPVEPKAADKKKDKKADVKRSAVDNEVDDPNAGEWVTVHKKEKKERKPTNEKKPDQQSSESLSAALIQTFYKTKKERKLEQQQQVGGDQVQTVDVVSNQNGTETDKLLESTVQKEEEAPQPKPVLVKQTSVNVAEPVVDDFIAEDPEPEDVLPASKQQSKKSLKNQKNKRTKSESENPILPAPQQAQEEQLPVKVADKVTAQIVAQYEAPVEKAATKPKKKKPVAEKAVAVAPVAPAIAIVEQQQASAKPVAPSKPSKGAAKKVAVEAAASNKQELVADIPSAKNDVLEGE